MSEKSPGARAVEALEISDVFVVEARCNIARDFNPMESLLQMQFQHRVIPEKEGIAQSRKEVGSDKEINVLRYFIDCGLRVLRPQVPETVKPEEITQQDVLAEIQAKLAVDYICPKALLQDEKAIGAFAQNVVFHAWPYWRTLIHTFSDQMRMPRITLPMLRPGALSSAAQTSASGAHAEPSRE